MNFNYSAQDIAHIVFTRIISRFGVPEKLISDRDPRFTGKFWRRLFELIGTKLAMSSAYHPQSDGMTERVNRTLETVIRTTVNASQDDWADHLPSAEFAINDTPGTTGFTPFQLMYGKHPRKPIDFTDKKIVTPAAEEYVTEIRKMIDRARKNILQAQQHQKTQADKKRRDHEFKIEDQVYLSTKNLTLPTASRKLSPKWVGPFKIIRQLGKDSFELDLQGKFAIHPVFHSSLLKMYTLNNDKKFPRCKQPIPPPMVIEGEDEYVVEAILNKRKIRGKTEYLVKWEYYNEEDSSWEPEDNLKNAKKLIDKYNRDQSRGIRMIRSTMQGPSHATQVTRSDPDNFDRQIRDIPNNGITCPPINSSNEITVDIPR
jgi:hypothetical protein